MTPEQSSAAYESALRMLADPGLPETFATFENGDTATWAPVQPEMLDPEMFWKDGLRLIVRTGGTPAAMAYLLVTGEQIRDNPDGALIASMVTQLRHDCDRVLSR